MMRESIQGRAWKVGDNVSTDSIAPGRLISLRANPNEFAKHLLEDARPDLAGKVQQDDFIVAGKNFGCGSSREIAPIIIKIAGVGAVLAKSFGRIFYRNAVNNGMLLVQCDTDQIEEGDRIILDIQNRQVRREGDPGFVLPFTLSDQEIRIIEEGGLLNYIEKHNSLEF